jgi:glutamyl-tRNA reductase
VLISLAIDFRRADLKTRERFFLTDQGVAQLYAEPRPAAVQELLLLSTCNRIELYGWASVRSPAEVLDALGQLARHWMGEDSRADELVATAEQRCGEEAARHLLRVAGGLESLVLGDAQILGQVKAAYRRADEAGALGAGLHRLCDTALRTGKRVQHETGLIGGRNSVGAEAAILTHRRLGNLASKRVVIVGCGKTGTRAARQLVKLGAVDVVLINRSPHRAQQLAAEVWGRAAPFGSLHREIANADVAIVATGADVPPVRAASLKFCREMAGTSSRELLLVDLSMPRNIESEVVGLEGVSLVDLDTLQPPVAAAEAARLAAVPGAERVVTEELAEFMRWVNASAAREAIRPLREVLGELCRREVAFAAGDEVAERTADRIVAKLLARPMETLRLATARGERVDGYAEALQVLFAPQPARVEGHATARAAAEAE